MPGAVKTFPVRERPLQINTAVKHRFRLPLVNGRRRVGVTIIGTATCVQCACTLIQGASTVRSSISLPRALCVVPSASRKQIENTQ